MITPPIFAEIVGAIGILLLLWSASPSASVLGRLRSVGDDDEAAAASPDGHQVTLARRVIIPMVERVGALLTSFTPQHHMTDLAKLLDQAGQRDDRSAQAVLGLELISAIGVGAVTLALVALAGLDPALALVGVAMGTVGGGLLPRFNLQLAGKARRRLMQRALPDVVDLLTISVEAGLAFQAALVRVCTRLDDELSRELRRTVGEIQLGVPMPRALSEMAERIDLPDLTAFVRVILQSQTLGTGVGKILRIQSEQIRRARRQRAEELGQKAPVKMLLPMVGCIFPTLFIVLLGPAAVKLLVH